MNPGTGAEKMALWHRPHWSSQRTRVRLLTPLLGSWKQSISLTPWDHKPVWPFAGTTHTCIHSCAQLKIKMCSKNTHIDIHSYTLLKLKINSDKKITKSLISHKKKVFLGTHMFIEQHKFTELESKLSWLTLICMFIFSLMRQDFKINE